MRISAVRELRKCSARPALRPCGFSTAPWSWRRGSREFGLSSLRCGKSPHCWKSRQGRSAGPAPPLRRVRADRLWPTAPAVGRCALPLSLSPLPPAWERGAGEAVLPVGGVRGRFPRAYALGYGIPPPAGAEGPPRVSVFLTVGFSHARNPQGIPSQSGQEPTVRTAVATR